ncbi:S24 family peptidase [Aliamphritea ceti]|uniref:S24 family peptidase n=1 Tax=Aliamphritea ceti TaxID=1524258 RepID=UPI0021C4A656|nr:S24 family peptidase [Aliamphritea ceti]
MEMKDRIRQRMSECGLKAVDIVNKTGLSKGTISQWLNGHTQPRGDNLLILSNALTASPEWLQFGVVSQGSSEEQLHFKTYEIPVLDVQLSAGFGSTQDAEAVIETMPVPERLLEEFGVHPQNANIVSVKGDSMETTLRDGEKIIVDTAHCQLISNSIYAFAFDGELKVKRFIKNFDQNWTIRSDNNLDPAYQDQTVAPHNIKQLQIIGRVAGILARKL